MADDRAPLRVVCVGWGAIARTVAGYLEHDPVTIVGVAVRRDDPTRPPVPAGAQLIADPGQLAELRPSVVVEAAGRDAVEPWGRAALDLGADVLVSSVSAFADASVLDAMRTVARRTGGRIMVSPGALAGVEALAAASVLGVDVVEHRIVKPPQAWMGTPAEREFDLDALDTPTVLLQASASEVARRFPKNANVAMTTALAGIGPAATTVTLVADPSAAGNRHELSASGGFGRLDVAIENAALPGNPKSSAMAALSLVRALRNRVSAFVI